MNAMKLRFVLGGTIIFVLGLILSDVRGFQIQEAILLVIGILLLVTGLFWQGKPPRRPDAQGTTP